MQIRIILRGICTKKIVNYPNNTKTAMRPKIGIKYLYAKGQQIASRKYVTRPGYAFTKFSIERANCAAALDQVMRMPYGEWKNKAPDRNTFTRTPVENDGNERLHACKRRVPFFRNYDNPRKNLNRRPSERPHSLS